MPAPRRPRCLYQKLTQVFLWKKTRMSYYTYNFKPNECRQGANGTVSCDSRGQLGRPETRCEAATWPYFTCMRRDETHESNFVTDFACAPVVAQPERPWCGATSFVCPGSQTLPLGLEQAQTLAFGPWKYL